MIYIKAYCLTLPMLYKKLVSMITKYHNHTLQTNPRHREEEPQNNYSKILVYTISTRVSRLPTLLNDYRIK